MIRPDWSEAVPSDWDVKPLRSVARYLVSNVDKLSKEHETPVRLCNYSDVYNNEFITHELDFMHATATDAEIDRFRLASGDVLITKDSESWDDIAVPALVSETAPDLICGYHLAMIRPDPQWLEGPFLLRCLQAKPIRLQLELASNGVTRFGLPKAAIGSARLPVPPLDTQRAICETLDRETARLDALISVKRDILTLIDEKLESSVFEAVTRGTQGDTELVESGIEWLGVIPARWTTKRAKWLFAERDDRSEDGEEVLLSLRMDRGLVPHNDVSAKQIRSEDLVGYKRVAKGDIVVNRMRAASGLVAVARQDGLVSPDYAVFRAGADADPDYFAHLFRTRLLRSVFRSKSTGLGTGSAGFLRLYSHSFLELWLPCPSIEEQALILSHVDRMTARMRELKEATERSGRLLVERRASVVADMVTRGRDRGGGA